MPFFQFASPLRRLTPASPLIISIRIPASARSTHIPAWVSTTRHGTVPPASPLRQFSSRIPASVEPPTSPLQFFGLGSSAELALFWCHVDRWIKMPHIIIVIVSIATAGVPICPEGLWSKLPRVIVVQWHAEKTYAICMFLPGKWAQTTLK